MAAIPTQSCSHHAGKSDSGRSQELLWAAEGPCTKLLRGWADALVHISTQQLSGDMIYVFMAGGGALKGRRVPVLLY